MNKIEIRGTVKIPKHVLRDQDLKFIEDKLVYRSKYDRADTELVKGYIDNDDHFLVPRFWFEKHLAKRYTQMLVDVSPAEPRQDWPFNGKLRSHQIMPKDDYASFPRVVELLLRHTGLFVSAPCGSGKTVCGNYVISQLGVSAMVLTPGETVRDQWIAAIKMFLPELVVTEYSGKRKNLSGDVVVASLQLMAKAPIQRAFGLLIVDEAHMSSTKEFQKAIYNVQFRNSLAFTATGNRFDGMDPLFRNALGTKEIELDTDQMPVSVRFEPYPLSSNDAHYLARFRSERVDAKMSMITYRNSKLIKAIQAAYLNARKIVVISKSIEQLMLLRTVFQKLEPDAKTALFCGDVTRKGKVVKELKRSAAQVREDETYVADADAVLFATTGKVGTGWDCAEKDALILGLPMLDIRQVIGRVQRFVVGKPKPIVLYPVDDLDSIINRAKGTYWGALWPLIQRGQCRVDNRCDYLELGDGPGRRTNRSSSTKSSTPLQGKFFTTKESGDLYE